MSFLDLSRRRRSVRAFQDRSISDDDLRSILEAGNMAPSAHNKQAWKFVVIRGARKRQLADVITTLSALFPKKSRMLLRMAAKSISSCDVVVTVFSTGELLEEAKDFGDHMKKSVEHFFAEMEIQSASAAVQNMLLQATDLGIGSVWLGVVVMIARQIEAFTGVEGRLLAMVPLGYPLREGGGPRKKHITDVTVVIE